MKSRKVCQRTGEWASGPFARHQKTECELVVITIKEGSIFVHTGGLRCGFGLF